MTAAVEALFETMGALGGRLPLWERHLARLAAGAARLGVADFAVPGDLRARAEALLRERGEPDGVLRLEWRDGAFAMAVRARGGPRVVRLLPCVVQPESGAPPADLKAMPRTFYDALLAEARASGADDGIAIGRDGALLETATCNLWVRLGGAWCTPPLDGRVLPGVARAFVLERGGASGIEVCERRVDLGDLHRAEALAVTNAVHGPRAATLLGQEPMAPDPALRRLWQDAVQEGAAG